MLPFLFFFLLRLFSFPLAFFLYLFCFSSFNLLFYWYLHTYLCVGYYNLPHCLCNKTFFRMPVYDKCKHRYKTNSSDIALQPCLIRNGATTIKLDVLALKTEEKLIWLGKVMYHAFHSHNFHRCGHLSVTIYGIYKMNYISTGPH